MLGACEAPHSENNASPEKAPKPSAVVGTAVLAPAEIAQKIEGIATVLSPDPVVQIDAELRAATIASDFSKKELARYKSSSSLSRHTVENAERQADTDANQLALLESRLRHTWGDEAPFLASETRQELMRDLSSGGKALVRLDFPESSGSLPRNVRVAPLGRGGDTLVSVLWVAPSGNIAMPGASYFGIITTGPGLRPGDRARLTAETSAPRSGVVIPNSAIIVFAGQSWCYVETRPQEYERRPVTLEFPVADGYLVEEGFTAGTKVVVRGASTLLSREAAPAEDEEDGQAQSPAGQKDAPESTGPPLARAATPPDAD
jgi:hypothetical protein